MIISGGSNIYPREIEEVLLRHRRSPSARSSAGRTRMGRRGRRLYSEKSPVERHDLDSLCIGNIARYKRPREYRFVDSLPKNHYGKVLKTELRAQLAYGLQQSPRR